MHRRKVVIAAAIFGIGVAFAAEPVSERGVDAQEWTVRGMPWAPGKNMLMSTHEWDSIPSPPPR